MHAKSAVAVALLAAAPLVNAGNAIVHNKCSFPVYMWTVSNTAAAMKTLNTNEQISEPYLTNPDGGGISVKLSKTPDQYGEITQFEYTLTSTLWYDISNINGNPFMPWGMKLTTDDSSCRNVLCPAGSLCSAAYNVPDDNFATASCTPDANTRLELCSDNNDSSNSGSLGGVLNNAANVVGTGEDKKHHHHHHHHAHHHAHHHKAAPAPAPVVPVVPAVAPAVSSAVAPAVGAVNQVLTTFVTQVMTVTARDASPSAAPQPRAAAPKQNFHRHGRMES